jgi:hypothetical protein
MLSHVEHMKPYYQRPRDLCHEGIYAALSTAEVAELGGQDKLESLFDRRATAAGKWEYKWKARDATESEWVSEAKLVNELKMPSWALDTFHALYELRHEAKLPEYAERLKPREDGRLRQEEAMRKFPAGTQVMRETRPEADTKGKHVLLVRGSVKSFKTPYWRIGYEDGLWEDLTSTEIRAGMALAEAVRTRVRNAAKMAPEAAAAVSEEVQEEAAMSLVVSPTPPKELGSQHVGQQLRYKFGSGWATGTIVKYVKGSIESGSTTLDVSFKNTGAKQAMLKRVQLRTAYYRDDRDAQMSSWNLLLSEALVIPPEPAQDEE